MQSNKILPTICSIIALASLQASALAQSGNDFFGSSVPQTSPGGGTPIDRPPGVAAAEQAALKAGSTDLSSDEKRMQRKYKSNMHAANDLIAKADKMIKDGEKKGDKKAIRKGQILKDVAERDLKNLKDNSPLPDKN
jgi:hypothetical protein